jgi:opacity protein-like surface antigen
MANRFIARASAALLFLVAVVGGGARAQSYDGDGLLKFGIFLQGASSPFGASERLAAAASTLTTASDRIRGFGGGVGFGYDWSPHRRWLIGFESDVAFDGASKAIATNDFSTQYLATFRTRLGVYAQPGVLIYGTGGYALLGAKYVGDNAGLSSRLKQFATLDGYVVGGGLELDWQHAIVFGEYLYADFHTWEFSGAGGNSLSVDASSHVVRLGIKFKYGHDHRN